MTLPRRVANRQPRFFSTPSPRCPRCRQLPLGGGRAERGGDVVEVGGHLQEYFEHRRLQVRMLCVPPEDARVRFQGELHFIGTVSTVCLDLLEVLCRHCIHHFHHCGVLSCY